MLKMKLAAWFCSTLFVIGLHTPLLSSADIDLKNSAKTTFFKLPLYFEKNEGQTDPCVKYISRQQECSLFFTSDSVVMMLPKQVSSPLKLQFVGSKSTPHLEGMNPLECKSNYFAGNDSKKWITNISNFAKVCYREMYPGVDIVFYGNNGQLEYDICVAPGGDPLNARMHIEGAKCLSIDQGGNLQITTGDNKNIAMQKPYIYQISNEKQVAIDGTYVLLAHNDIGFRIENYDTNKTLIIDPILSYSSYLGGSVDDNGAGIAVDNYGNLFVAGSTNSPDFPTTSGAYQTTLMGAGDAFVTKINIAESKLIYSTYIGNGSPLRGIEISGLAIDNAGNAYIVGSTDSPTYPTTSGAFQTTLNGLTNCVITKLNPTGSSLVYSTYLGGSAEDRGDVSGGIAVDQNGKAYINGGTMSTDFPTTVGAYQTSLAGTNSNSFVTKINATGTNLIYSTYLGGSNPSTDGDKGNGITIDSNGNAYVTGSAESSNFPTTAGAFQITLNGNTNCFVSKLNPTGSNLVYSTYLGGSAFDEGSGIALDNSGNAYVAGLTASSNFPVTPGVYQTHLLGIANCFITKFNATGTGLVFSTYLGGSGVEGDGASGIAVDSQGNAYITGDTSSSNFPITSNAYQSTFTGTTNGFVSELDDTGSNLIYSTYLGGSDYDACQAIALDSSANIYVTGFATSSNFPVTSNAYQSSLAGSANAFISIFEFNPAPATNLYGKRIKNKFLTQTDYINQLTWTPSTSADVTGYYLYRDGILIAQIAGNGPFIYDDHNRKKNQTYTYTLVAFTQNGLDSIPITIIL